MKCPQCGSENAYQGLNEVECINESCANFSERQRREVLGIKHPEPPLEPGETTKPISPQWIEEALKELDWSADTKGAVFTKKWVASAWILERTFPEKQ